MFEGSEPVPQRTQIASGDPRFYSPQRDIAYIAPFMVQRILQQLPQVVEDPAYRDFLVRYYGSEAAWADGGKFCADMESLANAMCQMLGRIKKGEHSDMVGLVKESGFLDVPDPAKILTLARLGELLLGAMFMAIKDVTPQDGEPPNVRRLEEMVQEGAKLAAHFHNRSQ